MLGNRRCRIPYGIHAIHQPLNVQCEFILGALGNDVGGQSESITQISEFSRRAANIIKAHIKLQSQMNCRKEASS